MSTVLRAALSADISGCTDECRIAGKRPFTASVHLLFELSICQAMYSFL